MQVSTKDKFIHAANLLFYEKGFHATGLDEIIDAVGVTKTTFYKHFESKDELAIAVLHRRDAMELTEWMGLVAKRGGGDPKAEILALFDEVEEWLSDPGFAGCMFFKAASEYPSPNDPVHQAAMRHGQNLFRELEKRAAMAGALDARGLAAQLMLLLTGAVLARHETGMPDQARSARAAAGVLVEAQTAR
ncbi:MAG: TetR/AcrR family transcriptional regulator [Phycisphaeraceae bacterium]|nr:TetR/AcrR family transcriptional regulator [Phycisphaeraceae bacterium]